MVPVLVTPAGGCPYKAAARLHPAKDASGAYMGSYSVTAIYGKNPANYSSIQPDPDLGCNSWVPEPDRQQLREIEVDGAGHVFVLAAQAASPDNDWLLIYGASTGDASEHAEMISGLVRAPTAMLVSANRLYLASSIEPSSYVSGSAASVTTRVYRFDITCYSGGGSCLAPLPSIDISNPTDLQQDRGYGYFARITAIRADPTDGKIYVTGFTAPRFAPTQTFSGSESLFTLPTLAVLDPAASAPGNAIRVDCHNLGLPLSVAFGRLSTSAVDLNGDGVIDRADVDLFRSCASRAKTPYASPVPANCPTDSQGRSQADLDGDGDVDLDDFARLQRCLGRSPSDPGCAE